MDSYKQLYLHLFNAMTDAIRDLEDNNTPSAIHRLVEAQRQTEEWYINDEEAVPPS